MDDMLKNRSAAFRRVVAVDGQHRETPVPSLTACSRLLRQSFRRALMGLPGYDLTYLRLAQLRSAQLFQMTNSIYLRGPLCPTCCQKGARRLHVLVARNPFARAVSSYKQFMRNALTFSNFIRIGFSTCSSQNASVLPTPSHVAAENDHSHFHDWVCAHMVPMIALMKELKEVDALVQTEVYVMRIETLAQDMRQLEKRLCAKLRICESLPVFPTLNRAQSVGQPPEWDEATRKVVLRWYRADFRYLGYANDPKLHEPVRPPFGHVGRFRLMSP
eukprot:TRINITY_DN71597_c0_g1_i1.p1 TRINITY_DN71597_c0_g1~~TRINITY_DN71597_c0_g1_i1.p1  ORF type:complete len:320 (-),score=23.35 TRINITY_DN71597_c0_g1_i1:3-824(-)